MKLALTELVDRFATAAPAAPSEIAAIEKFFNYAFPADYKALLQTTNGLEGRTDRQYLVLWSTQELMDLNTAYQVKEFVADVIIFGSDGAEDAFGFDTSVPTVSIVKLPFIGMGYLPNEKLAGSFEAFLSSQGL